jgi:protease I
MTTELQGMKIAFVATDGVEQVELTEPWRAVANAGGTPVLASMKPGKIQGFNHRDKGEQFDVDLTASAAMFAEFDALVLPGGVANPDALRTDPATVEFIGQFARAGKPIAVICHGPWTLIEADAVKGRTLTSWPSLQTDLRNAGATWRDEQVVVCHEGPGVIVSSRRSHDLPAFTKTLVDIFQRAGSRA